MKIAEIYGSIQGEGLLTGTPSVFVRASGCNLRCWFCDTPYASWQPEGDDLGVDEIFEQVKLLGQEHVVLTGGEPMLFAELIPLADRAARGGQAHHDRNGRHALSAGGLRFDVDQPEAFAIRRPAWPRRGVGGGGTRGPAACPT